MSDSDLLFGGKKPTPPSPVVNKPQEEAQPVSSPQKILTRKQESNKGNLQESKKVNKQESLQVSNITSKQAITEASMEERLLTLLQVDGLKPNTFRWTQDELDFIRDINYQAEVKYKTKFDKNDVARLGVDYLIEDWKENKEESLIARILTRKQESK